MGCQFMAALMKKNEPVDSGVSSYFRTNTCWGWIPTRNGWRTIPRYFLVRTLVSFFWHVGSLIGLYWLERIHIISSQISRSLGRLLGSDVGNRRGWLLSIKMVMVLWHWAYHLSLVFLEKSWNICKSRWLLVKYNLKPEAVWFWFLEAAGCWGTYKVRVSDVNFGLPMNTML